MSSRQLRKLQKQRELEGKISQETEDGDEVEEEAGPSTPKPRVNLFAALGGGDEDAPEDEDEQEQDAEDAQQDLKEAPAPASGKKSKKKKKKKKAKAGAATEDEIDKAIKELQIKPRHGDTSSAATAIEMALKSNQLLKIDPYHLKAIHEMRTLFGRDVIESANAEEEQEHNRRVRQTGMQQDVDLETFLRELPGTKKLPEVSLRRNIFVQGREYWPLRTAGGLTMEEVGKAADGSSTEYAYFHDKEYDGVEIFFFTCVQAGDPMRMVHLLKQVPYHISTLLQVSFVAKQDQNMALAAELCERALFTFGRVTTASFRQNIEQGKARLDFRRPENRQFWLAGYHYIRSLIRKGTYRTALEWTKLLYSLDPMDPYAMRHYIHVLAIRAHESSWLLGFLDQLDQQSDNRDEYVGQSRVLARLQMGDTEQARRDLTSGMQRVPWLYCALFQELNLDAPPAIWGIGAESNARMFWVKLYLQQTKDLWNNAQAIALLQDVAQNMGRVDVECLPANDAPVDLGATRLAYLEGQTSLLEVAPREFLDREPNYEFDPLPPPKAENIFTGEGTQLPWRDQHAQAPGIRHYDVLARMLLAQREEGQAGDGAMGFDGLGADDEELEQDIMAQMTESNEPGLLQTFMQMLGLDRGDSGEGSGGDAGNDIWGSEVLPGSWPAEDDDDDE